MPWSRVFAASLVVAAVALLGGCAPGPSASPTPTPLYTSDEDALAAAEQVYRDYIDAYNAVDLADPATFEPVYALSTGDNLNYLKKEFSRLHADGWSISGDRGLDLFAPRDGPFNTLALRVSACLHAGDVDLRDAQGVSQSPLDRPESLAIYVDVARSDLTSSWLVEDERGRDDGPPCV